MKHITIVVPQGPLILSSIVGPYKIFNKVNDYLLQTGLSKTPFYEITVASTEKTTFLYDGIFSIHCNEYLSDVKKTDLVIIPSFLGDFPRIISENKALIDWVRKQHVEYKTEVASLCTGALLLAATGVVNNKQCSTHWLAADFFRATFPQVHLVPEKVIVDDAGIYSSGGAYSFLNLLLHMVEKFNGREVALWISKVFEIEIGRESQSQFTIFNTQKNHDDGSILEAQNHIESHVDRKVSVEELAGMTALSRRNFIRRFKKATGNTPLEYIQRVKVEAAKKSFESDNVNVNEVMYAIGYNDNKAFRQIFKKITGLSPIEYKSKYYRLALA